jgi:hypothetical protein
MVESKVAAYLNKYLPKNLHEFLSTFLYQEYKNDHRQRMKPVFEQLYIKIHMIKEIMQGYEDCEAEEYEQYDYEVVDYNGEYEYFGCVYSWYYSYRDFGNPDISGWQVVQVCKSCKVECDDDESNRCLISDIRIRRYLRNWPGDILVKSDILAELEQEFSNGIRLVPVSSYKSKWERPKFKQYIWRKRKDIPDLSEFEDISEIDFCSKKHRQ